MLPDIYNILCNKYIMIKYRNRLTKTMRFGKLRHTSKRSRRMSRTTMSKYKKTKRVRRSKTRKNIKSRRRYQCGGGFVSDIMPEDLLNSFRSIPAAVGHFTDTLSGQYSPASSYPYPTNQPNVVTNNIGSSQHTLLPLNDIYNNASTNVMSF